MNTILQKLKCLFLVGILSASVCQQVRAGHAQGAEMAYTQLAPGVYMVRAVLYRDCLGISTGTTIPVNIKSPGCNAGRTVIATYTGVSAFGNPYCGHPTQSPCTPNGQPNFERRTYQATVTFSAAEQICQHWYVSTTVSGRPSVKNLVNAQSKNLYVDAYILLGSGIANTSPELGPMDLTMPYMLSHNTRMVASYNGIDPDGDSLVYTLEPALDNYNVPIAYGPIAPTALIENKNPSPPFNTTSNKQYASLPTNQYSPDFPLPSYLINWNLPNQIVPATPYIDMDTQSGSFSFLPAIYTTPTGPFDYSNSYTIAVMATEYRKINGVTTKIGHIRRDMMINIAPQGTNDHPIISEFKVNNVVSNTNTMIHLIPGMPLNIQFLTADQNQNDVIDIQSTINLVLPGGVYNTTPGNRPTGSISWTPTAAHVRDVPYFFTITLRDNSCPIKGQQTRTIGVTVSNTMPTGIQDGAAFASGFMVYPNPFAAATTFRINLAKPAGFKQILIYNILGQQVDKIELKNMKAGEQDVAWEKAAWQPAGQYMAKLTGEDNAVQTIKFTKRQ